MATAIGTKGSDVYTFDGVNDPRVALYVLLVRDQNQQVINEGLLKILYNSIETIPDKNKLIEDAFVLAFMTRNIRGGKGERDISTHMFKILLNEKPEIMNSLLDLIPEYGYWKDIFTLWEESTSSVFQKKLSEIVITQLKKDEENALIPDKNISLLAKWIPRQTRQASIAKYLAEKLFPETTSYSYRMKQYRQMVVN
jgi:hypothetical protein